MQTKRVGFLAQVAPVVVGLMGITAASVHASEAPSSTEVAIATEPIVQSSAGLSRIAVSVQNQSLEATDDASSQFKDAAKDSFRWVVGDEKLINVASTLEGKNQPGRITASFTPLQLSPELSEISLDDRNSSENKSISSIISINFREYNENFISDRAAPLSPTTSLEAESFTSEPWISQAETTSQTNPDTGETDPALEESTPDPEATTASPRWQINVIPYGFVPLSVDGSATVKDFTADIDLGLDDILDPLNFAAAGRVEAWRANLGLIFDGAYFSTSQENSTSTSVPNCLCNIFPSKIDTEVNVQYGQFDLGVGYRTAANLSDAKTEFDLGPLVFDAIAGMRIYALHQEINLSTNLGTNRDRSESSTLITPLISGRLRWNLSPTVAGWVRGDIAGFGIGGTLMAASVTGGIDWMFSGNTSLLLAYRISSLQYSTDIRGEDFKLDLLMQGPYLGVVFRF